VHKARTALRQIVGNEIPVVPHESGKHLVAKIGLDTEALMASGASEIFVVAGGRFELYSAYPIRVPAVSASVFATR